MRKRVLFNTAGFPSFRVRSSRPLLAAVCLLLAALFGYASGGLYAVREVKPNIFVWIPEDVIDQDGDPQFSRAANAGFIITPDGVVAVDTTSSPFHGRELLYEIRRRTDAPIKYVINTDLRGDHTLGNEVFIDQQAIIVATGAAQAGMRRYQRELARRLDEDWRLQARMRGIHPTLPAQTFEGQLRLRLGGEEIELISANPGSPDLIVYLPDAKALFLGDLFENGYFPSIDSRLEPMDVRRWIEFLGAVERWNVDTYIPAHGEPGGKKELADFRDFLSWLTREVETRINEGKSLEQVKQEIGPLDRYHWHAPELATSDVEAVYRDLAQEHLAVPTSDRAGSRP